MSVTSAAAHAGDSRVARKADANVEKAYQTGINNEHSSEAVEGALPVGQNSPQKAPLGLYAEQISGTSFTVPRAQSKRSWLYRIRPSVAHTAFEAVDEGLFRTAPIHDAEPTPNRFRWSPLPIPSEATDFLSGIKTIAATGDAEALVGAAYHVYTANADMKDRVFANHDGEMLIAPQLGSLLFVTELGSLDVRPGEVIVIPRGLKFRVDLGAKEVRGFICENYGEHFRLPELGPIGANGLANPRDFLVPTARYDGLETPIEQVIKSSGKIWKAMSNHSPFDVVAWHGSWFPYKYDLDRFMSLGSVSYDHTDPSLQGLLTSPSGFPGVSNVDVTVFPPRWFVSEHSFRPPYFHRNVMCEFVCMLRGAHEAHGNTFPPGACSLHNSLAAHGPAPKLVEAAINETSDPKHSGEGIFILFETRLPVRPTKFAQESTLRASNYDGTWDSLPRTFSLKD